MKKSKALRTRPSKPKFVPIHPKLYPVIAAFHKVWFGECQCDKCRSPHAKTTSH